MNAKQLIAAVALIATGSVAFASDYQVGGEAYASFPIPSMIKTGAEPAKAAPAAVAVANTSSNGKTRAEVIAELAQARAEGTNVGGEAYVASNPATPARVAAETVKTATSK
ncbi:DUF4148 domain-containing protein [Undibacterium sp.]|jgi:hypothetical protein|uniref:DUF4148 domain-containing protein n=1 Tax=Undibacterium sp. TaxID=1914977 RepID=UPI002CAEF2B4|nr:DUF4148 domain-containing protein [Undibacterium sp.]HTD06554.1 DUF4148 domain-containing protein [Undibacterium sp.]